MNSRMKYVSIGERSNIGWTFRASHRIAKYKTQKANDKSQQRKGSSFKAIALLSVNLLSLEHLLSRESSMRVDVFHDRFSIYLLKLSQHLNCYFEKQLHKILKQIDQNKKSSQIFLSFLFELLQQNMGKGIQRKEVGNPHHLVIQALGQVYFDKTVRVDFTPQVKESQLKKLRKMDQNIPKSILPTFNNDKLHFTPSFCIPAFQLDLEVYLQKHNSKIQKCSQIDQPDILVPKPRNRFNCHVCSTTFQDYNQHIRDQNHLQNQRSSRYHKKIMKLCRKLQKKSSQRWKQKPKKEQIAEQLRLQPITKTKRLQDYKNRKFIDLTMQM